MTPLAVVILAHRDPRQLHRLVAALPDVPIVLHCDRRTSAADYRRMLDGLPERVRAVPRGRTTLAGWSLVDAELRALRTALSWTNARHLAVLSGSDYPLMAVGELEAELAGWAGRSWFENVPVPTPAWDTPRQRDGGLWRFSHRYYSLRGQALFVRGFPLRSPLRREIPGDLELRAASQWKIFGREQLRRLFEVMAERPELVRFLQTSHVPDESFAASLLASPRLFGSDALPPCPEGAWFLDWPAGGTHPGWLGERHFDRLRSARHAERVRPDEPGAAGSTVASYARRKLFSRKFTSADPAVLDRIDAELH